MRASLAILLVVLAVSPACSRAKRSDGERKVASSTPAAKAVLPYAVPVVTAAASASSSPKSPPPAVASARVAGFDLKVTSKKGDAPDLRTALAYRYADSRVLHVLLSTHTRTCADVRAEEHETAPGEHQVELWVAPQLRASGQPSWAIVMAAYESPAGAESHALRKLGDAKVEADDPTKEVRLTVAEGTAAGELAFAGPIVAQGCGVLPLPETEPKPDDQKELALEVAGQRLTVRSALQLHDRFVLSTDAGECKYGGWEPQVTLTLEKDGTRGRLGGFLVAPVAHGDVDDTLAAPLTVTASEREGDRLQVAFAGTATISGLPVKLSGKASVVVCD